jgi:hypothetical protein
MEENMMTMNLKANMTTNLKANMATKESMAEKAIMEERTSKDIKVKTIGTIMEKMISTELNITLSTFYTQSNSLT